MPQSIGDILRSAEFFTDDDEYILLKLPSAAIMIAAGIVAEIGTPFNTLIVDKDEVSLLIQAEAMQDFEKRLQTAVIAEMRYRLITIDIVLEFDLIGFMAVISDTLAKAQVPILAMSAFSRDHILVPVDKFDIAMNALTQLKENV